MHWDIIRRTFLGKEINLRQEIVFFAEKIWAKEIKEIVFVCHKDVETLNNVENFLKKDDDNHGGAKN